MSFRIAIVALLLSSLACRSAVSDWTVTRSDVRPDRVENGSIGEVDYAGETTVNGTFQKHPDSDVNQLCFFVDETDRGKLPRFPNDQRRPWFCFTNEEQVRKLARDNMRARIRIRSFYYRYSHTDVFNTTEFVSIE